MPSKNDVAWETLFRKHRILNQIEAEGVYEISATTINEQREARLMTKFDHRIQLPSIFKQQGLTIQPITRGTYLIGRFESYLDLPADLRSTSKKSSSLLRSNPLTRNISFQSQPHFCVLITQASLNDCCRSQFH